MNGTFTSEPLETYNVSWMEPSLRNRFHSFGTSRNLVQGFGRLPQTTPKLYWKNPKPFRLLGKNTHYLQVRFWRGLPVQTGTIPRFYQASGECSVRRGLQHWQQPPTSPASTLAHCLAVIHRNKKMLDALAPRMPCSACTRPAVHQLTRSGKSIGWTPFHLSQHTTLIISSSTAMHQASLSHVAFLSYSRGSVSKSLQGTQVRTSWPKNVSFWCAGNSSLIFAAKLPKTFILRPMAAVTSSWNMPCSIHLVLIGFNHPIETPNKVSTIHSLWLFSGCLCLSFGREETSTNLGHL